MAKKLRIFTFEVKASRNEIFLDTVLAKSRGMAHKEIRARHARCAIYEKPELSDPAPNRSPRLPAI